MRVEHLIDGRPVAGRSYFETVDPATQDVLAEVARGGPAEIDAAVTAAKRAFPAWATTPPRRARAPDEAARRPDHGARAGACPRPRRATPAR